MENYVRPVGLVHKYCAGRASLAPGSRWVMAIWSQTNTPRDYLYPAAIFTLPYEKVSVLNGGVVTNQYPWTILTVSGFYCCKMCKMSKSPPFSYYVVIWVTKTCIYWVGWRYSHLVTKYSTSISTQKKMPSSFLGHKKTVLVGRDLYPIIQGRRNNLPHWTHNGQTSWSGEM